MQESEIPVAQRVNPPRHATQANASSRATITLVLGVLAITCTGLLTGIPAIILGFMELRAIKAGHAPAGGESSAKVGLVLGLIGTILAAIAIIAFIIIVALGISLGTSDAIHNVIRSSI